MFRLLSLNSTKKALGTTLNTTCINSIYKPIQFLQSYTSSSSNDDGNSNKDEPTILAKTSPQPKQKAFTKPKGVGGSDKIKILKKSPSKSSYNKISSILNNDSSNSNSNKVQIKTNKLKNKYSKTLNKEDDSNISNNKTNKEEQKLKNSVFHNDKKQFYNGGGSSGSSGGTGSSGSSGSTHTMLASKMPKQVIAIPVSDYVVFPGSYVPLPFTDAEYREMGSPTHIGLFLITPAEKEIQLQEETKLQDTPLLATPLSSYSSSITNANLSNKLKKATNITTFSSGIPDISKINKIGVLASVVPQHQTLLLIGSSTIEIVGVANNNSTEEQDSSSSPNESTVDNDQLIQPIVPQVPASKFLKVNIEPYKHSESRDDIKIRALTLQLARNIHIVKDKHPDSLFSAQLNALHSSARFRVEDPNTLVDSIGPLCLTSPSEYQKLLECTNLEDKLNMVLSMVIKKYQLLEFNFNIEKQLEDKTIKQQRKYFLLEQMKIIRKELGIDIDEKETLKNKFNSRWANIIVHDKQIKQAFKEEMEKLSGYESHSSEYNVARNYLDWLTLLPWNVYSNDNFDIAKIKETLDKEHYGLKDIKEMIQTFIAVGKLRGSVGGKIILLVGPPGTGKTSIGKSIANALERQFYRISVGGLSDVSEIKGHRRTYIASMPGKIIQALKTVKTSNPVILIDEIDKISQSHHGDPNAALLEVLDPQQNKNFMDHYLDVPYDLSKVLFICTANSLHSIPDPLLDRMDVMRLNGYIQSEQMEIAERYLLPLVRNETGLKEDQLEITPEAIKQLCELYCREAGVRHLKKFIEKIFRKMAYKISTGEETKVIITPDNLHEFVGPVKYRSNRLFQTQKEGIVMGLGWTAGGGGLIHIESALERWVQGPGLRTTGSLGDVMKESIDISYSYVKEFLGKLDPSNRYFDTNSIHIHAPDGSTEKDISTAGITIISSLLSLATGKLVKPDLAMVGEITLTGKVIGVGGIIDKMIAAKRESIKTVIIPKDNKKQLEEIPDFIKEGMEIYLVDYYKDVYSIAFTDDNTIKPIITIVDKEQPTQALNSTI